MENGMGSEMPEQPQEMPKTVSYGRRGADPRVIVGAAVAVLLVLAFLFLLQEPFLYLFLLILQAKRQDYTGQDCPM